MTHNCYAYNGTGCVGCLRDNLEVKGLPFYAWPGGYPLIYHTEQGLVICAECASREESEDPAIMYEVFYEGPDIFCDDCNAPIESAYGDPFEKDDYTLLPDFFNLPLLVQKDEKELDNEGYVDEKDYYTGNE